jgi:hypothetical protein
MNIEKYSDLPDAMSTSQVGEVLDIFFQDCEGDFVLRMKKLDVICDRQWHSYEEAPQHIKDRVSDWLMGSWVESQEFFEFVLGVCYSFGLSKVVFCRAMNGYSGGSLLWYKEVLEKSSGEFIDPYFSMKN